MNDKEKKEVVVDTAIKVVGAGLGLAAIPLILLMFGAVCVVVIWAMLSIFS